MWRRRFGARRWRGRGGTRVKLISYDGYNFATNNYWAAFEPGAGLGQWSVLPQIRARHNAAGVLTGAQITERAIPVVFGYIKAGGDTYETAFLKLLGKLDPLYPYPRKLVAELNSGIQVQCWAMVTTPGGVVSGDEVNTLPVTFVTTSPYWEETAESTATGTFTSSGTHTITKTNAGQVSVPGRLEFTFSAGADDNHWWYPVDITNNTDLNWYREVVVVDIGSTTSTTASTENYVTVFYQGVEQPRTVLGYRTTRTYVAFPVTIAAGDTERYEVVIHKTGSGADAIVNTIDLQTFNRFDGNYCAFDLYSARAQATAGAATTVTTAATTAWFDNRLAGGFIEIYSGTGAGQCRRITASTNASVITVSRAWTTNPDATSFFAVHMSGWFIDGGRASAGTATTLTDSLQAWDTDVLKGGTVEITAGTGAGQTRTVDSNTSTVITVTAAWTTNPDATSVYTVRRYGVHTYATRQIYNVTNWRGGWQLSSRFSKPSRIAFGGDACNGWRRTTYLDNRDDYAQARSTAISVTLPGGGSASHYFPILDAQRRKSQDTRLLEEGTGDGVTITSALGYASIRFDYAIRNVNGVGQFVFAGREAGGEDWNDIVTNSATYASLTAVAEQYIDLTAYGTINHLYMGVLGKDGAEIPSTAAATDVVAAQWRNTLRLMQKPESVTVVVGSRDDRVRLSGKVITEAATLGELRFGKTAGTDRELFVPDDGTTKFVVDSETATCWLDAAGIKTYVPWAVLAIQKKLPEDVGATGTRIADRWLYLPTGSMPVDCESMPTSGNWAVFWTEAYFG